MKQYKEQTIVKGEGIKGGFYWPSVTRLSDGRLMVGCSGFRVKHVCPFGNVAVAYSSDEGKTWTQPESVLNTPLDDRDAGVLEYKGKIIITTFNNSRAFQRREVETNAQRCSEQEKQMFLEKINSVSDEDEAKYLGSLYFTSSDGGKSWSEPKKLPITAPHGMIELNDGRLFYLGRFFADQMADPEYKRSIEGIGYITSTDGVNFTQPKRLTMPLADFPEGTLFCEPHAVCLKSGRIFAAIRVQNAQIFTTYTCYSDDNGETFTMPKAVELPTGEQFWGAPPHLMQHSSGALVMTYGRRNNPCGERAVVSYDDGETWSKELVLNCEPDPNYGDIGYPATVELNDGDLYTVYYTHRETNSVINAVRWNIKDVEEL